MWLESAWSPASVALGIKERHTALPETTAVLRPVISRSSIICTPAIPISNEYSHCVPVRFKWVSCLPWDLCMQLKAFSLQLLPTNISAVVALSLIQPGQCYSCNMCRAFAGALIYVAENSATGLNNVSTSISDFLLCNLLTYCVTFSIYRPTVELSIGAWLMLIGWREQTALTAVPSTIPISPPSVAAIQTYVSSFIEDAYTIASMHYVFVMIICLPTQDITIDGLCAVINLCQQEAFLQLQDLIKSQNPSEVKSCTSFFYNYKNLCNSASFCV